MLSVLPLKNFRLTSIQNHLPTQKAFSFPSLSKHFNSLFNSIQNSKKKLNLKKEINPKYFSNKKSNLEKEAIKSGKKISITNPLDNTIPTSLPIIALDHTPLFPGFGIVATIRNKEYQNLINKNNGYVGMFLLDSDSRRPQITMDSRLINKGQELVKRFQLSMDATHGYNYPTFFIFGKKISGHIPKFGIKNEKLIGLAQESIPNLTMDIREILNTLNVGVLAKAFQFKDFPTTYGYGDHDDLYFFYGLQRISIDKAHEELNYYSTTYKILEDPKIPNNDIDVRAYAQLIYKALDKKISDSPKISNFFDLSDINALINCATPISKSTPDQKQEILESNQTVDRLSKLYNIIMEDNSLIDAKNELDKKASDESAKNMKRYRIENELRFLTSLSESISVSDSPYIKKLHDKVIPGKVLEIIKSEIQKLQQTDKRSIEYGVTKEYLEWLSILPWGVNDPIHKDINQAKKILDEDHFGLQDIKERILEFIAVENLLEHAGGKIICFVGPPGVGKCLGFNTQVMLANGKCAAVQDIKPGHVLLGDDSNHRNVLSITKGFGKLFNIIDKNSRQSFVVNEEHILCLKFCGNDYSKIKWNKKLNCYQIKFLENHQFKTFFITDLYRKGKFSKKKVKLFAKKIRKSLNLTKFGDIVEISVKDYMKKSNEWKKLYCGYRTFVEFKEKQTDQDPFVLGRNSANHELQIAMSLENGKKMKPNTDTDTKKEKKRIIPENIKFNSKRIRQEYLDGFLESAAKLSKKRNQCEVLLSNSNFVNDFEYLCRSLGIHFVKSGNSIIKFRLYNFDRKTKRINYKKQNQKKEKDLMFPISVCYSGEGNYYGFELDGNGRFLLGDFTVTHNSSIAQSIARALERKFYRFSVGGMRDVGEIKGHRRTYVGALPGKMIQSLKITQTSNPVILIDEIDKIGQSFKGDPASALLEVLDPEQNFEFIDHYLDVPFDLSKITFILTANDATQIPRTLLDRLEVIQLSGYVLKEKLMIAKNHFLQKIKKETGLSKCDIQITDEAIIKIIRDYCREPGVRNLSNQLEKIYRKIAFKYCNLNSNQRDSFHVFIDKKDIVDYLGTRKYSKDRIFEKTIPGVATGLAWTPFGGVVIYIETIVSDVANLERKNKNQNSNQNSNPKKLVYNSNPKKLVYNSNPKKLVYNSNQDSIKNLIQDSIQNLIQDSIENLNQNLIENLNQNSNENLNQNLNQNSNKNSNGNSNQNLNQNSNQNLNGNSNENLNQNLKENSNQNSNGNSNENSNENSNKYEIREAGGTLFTTGNIGNVMQESTQIAYSFAKRFLEKHDKNNKFFFNTIHMHIPKGAIPKDGPSAGVTMVTALLSLALNEPVKQETAMTGEITLNGKVLAVGGIKEKVIGASISGIKNIILPVENKRDWDEIDPFIRTDLKVIFVQDYQEIFDEVFSFEKKN
ncbi:intein-containing protease precursor [Anaeramoeba ignava]|uniref:Lon protease homolog n=1 Tax=Anaeramoeba ignava TaxID=1746090 RepID=A0A9Q0LXQ4_ANAIG|nr:intein-containing protease precursor [Anaeramoeba ignava]